MIFTRVTAHMQCGPASSGIYRSYAPARAENEKAGRTHSFGTRLLCRGSGTAEISNWGAASGQHRLNSDQEPGDWEQPGRLWMGICSSLDRAYRRSIDSWGSVHQIQSFATRKISGEYVFASSLVPRFLFLEMKVES